jgi:hypothetical protein
MPDWIATRFGAFCVNSSGVLRTRTAVLDRAAKTCLLIDLGLAGRITHYYAQTEIDTAAIGFDPADTVLAYVDENPNGSMEEVIERCPVSILDVLGATFPPERTRRFFASPVALPSSYIATQRAAVERVLAGDIDDPATAALAAVLIALQMIPVDMPESLVARCGDVAWLVTDLVPYLRNMRERYASVAAWGTAGGG